MSDNPEREIAIFNGALQLPPEMRGAYLSSACGGNESLYRRVEQLLKVHDEASSFLEEARQNPRDHPDTEGPKGTVRVAPSPQDKEGDRIGRYKVLQQIGEGGGGVV